MRKILNLTVSTGDVAEYRFSHHCFGVIDVAAGGNQAICQLSARTHAHGSFLAFFSDIFKVHIAS